MRLHRVRDRQAESLTTLEIWFRAITYAFFRLIAVYTPRTRHSRAARFALHSYSNIFLTALHFYRRLFLYFYGEFNF